MVISTAYNDLISVLFPAFCAGCNAVLSQKKMVLCPQCLHFLPLTDYEKIKENEVERIFYGRVAFKKACAFLHFDKKSTVQQIIHQLKYKGRQEVGTFLGKWMGQCLKESGFYNGIDVVVPVPLHPKKLKQRGYNQVEKFGRAIAAALECDYKELLVKTKHTASSTGKKRAERAEVNPDIYALKEGPGDKYRNILLVDDIVTTGATAEACSLQLQKLKGVTLSLAVMAFTS